MAKNIITIPSKITKGKELVIIPHSLYDKIKREREEKIKEKLFKENTKIFIPILSPEDIVCFCVL